jgi:hypothetical protein
MFNVKWGIICGLVAFVLAFATSLLVGQALLSVALVRALIFAVLFFLLGTGAWTLINNFIPEVLSPSAGDDATSNIFSMNQTGSRVNITLGEQVDAALPDRDGEPQDPNDVGDINDLVSGAFKPEKRAPQRIDQNPENDYNDGSGEFAPRSEAEEKEEGFSVNFSSFVSSGDEAGETDPFSDPFSLTSGDDGEAAPERSSLPERKVTGNRPEKFEGDFNPKEIAAGIRTVLEKDKKG